MPDSAICPKCGGPLPKHRLSGLCPRCVSRRLFTADSPPETPAHEAELSDLAEGLNLGRYKLAEKIGEGGFGVVYAAEQIEPVRRRVAIKIIKLGMDTRSVVARFEAERQAVALMDHPNIARVLDAGATDTGRPYFVMELVAGERITAFCERRHLDIAARLELFIQICQAVQHAHQKGVIHRDLKPSNILITEQDGRPVPKVIDFGIAKAVEQPLTDKTLVTRFDHFIGTPSYMSPEQAELGGLDIDTRSDIYSLGVLLYELLTGRTPFDTQTLMKSGMDSALKTIREVEPPRPSTRLTQDERRKEVSASPRLPISASALRGDLDWIVMKCLEKDRARRYETANALALDLRRHLHSEPVTAAAPSASYRFGKFIRRNKTGFALATAAAVVLLTATGVSLWQLVRATRAEDSLEKRVVELRDERDAKERARQAVVEEQKVTRRMNYAADTYLAQRALEAGNYGRARRSLEEQRPRAGEEDLRGFEWRYLWQRTRGDQQRVLRGHSNQVAGVAFAPDGRTLFSAGWDNTVRVWDTATGELLRTLPLAGQAQSVTVSRDGTLLAGGSKGRLQLWNARTFETNLSLNASEARVAFSPTEDLLAVGLGGSPWGYNNPSAVKLFDTVTSRELLTLTNAGGRVAFSPDGRRLATGAANDEIKLWDVAERKIIARLRDARFTISLAFSPDSRRLAACEYNLPEIRVWDVNTGEGVGSFPGHEGRTLCVAFSPDGSWLASGGLDQQVRLWNLETGEPSAVLAGHGEAVTALAFSPDGQTLASASRDETVMLWSARPRAPQSSPTNLFFAHSMGTPVLSRDGTLLAAATTDRRLLLIDPATFAVRREISSPQSPQFPLAFSPDGGALLTFNYPSTVSLWDVAAGTNRARVNVRVPFNREAQTSLSPDGRLLAIGGVGQAQIFDLVQGRVTGSLAGQAGLVLCVIFSPDGRLLATSGQDSIIRLWDTATFKPIAALRGHRDHVRALAFTPDGRTLISGSHDHTARLWAVPSGELLATLSGHRDTASFVTVSPDGRTLATTGPDSMVKLWHLETRREVVSVHSESRLGFLKFLPDGRGLLLGGGEKLGLSLWPAPTLAEIDGVTNAAPVSPTTAPAPAWQLADLGTPEFLARQRPVFPPRAPGLEKELIDLSAHYNARLTDPLHNTEAGNDFSALPTGRQELGGVAWDIRGSVVLAGRRTQAAAPELPAQVTGLHVGQRAARLHFLHSCGYGGGGARPVGHYRVRYADGETVEVPITYGRDLLDWWLKPARGATQPVVAWSGENAHARARGFTIQLFKSTWKNPRTDVEITALDFVSAMTDVAPFLIAITAERP